MEINNISDELQKNHKVVSNSSWILVIFTMCITFSLVMLIVAYDAYNIKSNELIVEANNINNVINNEFSLVVNSINMNGYINTFEQYLKTTVGEKKIVDSIYYENTTKTLNNMTLISEEIENIFVVSFANKSVLYSGISNVYKENYDYEKQPWYNYNEIKNNNAYLSEEFVIDDESVKLFGIVRPIIDSMSDQPLGALVYCFNTNYLEKVFSESITNNRSEAIVRIDDGKILFSTKKLDYKESDEVFLEQKISSDSNITYTLDNESLNWNIISYCSVWEIFKNSINQFLVVIAVFVLLALTFNIFIKKLKYIKVIRTKKELNNIIDLNKIQSDETIEESLEEVYVDEYIEMPIEAVLSLEDDDKK